MLLLQLSVSGEYQMGEVPVEDISMLKLVKGVRYSGKYTVIMTYLAHWNMCYLYYFNGLTSLGLK